MARHQLPNLGRPARGYGRGDLFWSGSDLGANNAADPGLNHSFWISQVEAFTHKVAPLQATTLSRLSKLEFVCSR